MKTKFYIYSFLFILFLQMSSIQYSKADMRVVRGGGLGELQMLSTLNRLSHLLTICSTSLCDELSSSEIKLIEELNFSLKGKTLKLDYVDSCGVIQEKFSFETLSLKLESCTLYDESSQVKSIKEFNNLALGLICKEHQLLSNNLTLSDLSCSKIANFISNKIQYKSASESLFAILPFSVKINVDLISANQNNFFDLSVTYLKNTYSITQLFLEKLQCLNVYDFKINHKTANLSIDLSPKAQVEVLIEADWLCDKQGFQKNYSGQIFLNLPVYDTHENLDLIHLDLYNITSY